MYMAIQLYSISISSSNLEIDVDGDGLKRGKEEVNGVLPQLDAKQTAPPVLASANAGGVAIMRSIWEVLVAGGVVVT
jgi:hypothetical protein